MIVRAADPAPDAELIERARRGDRNAFDRLVARYRQDVYRMSYRMTGTHEDADDVVQETFLRAYRGLGQFRGDSALKTWLFRIAMNLSINLGRSKAARPDQNGDPESAWAAPVSPHEHADARLVRNERAARVRGVIEALPPRQRQVVILRVYEDLQFHEIATVLDCPIGTAKANFFHAMNNLRQVLA